MFTRLSLGGIWIYQRWISPHKGYRCAHSVLHGGTGCSGYVKQTLRADGIWQGWPKIRARFRACRLAYATLRDPDGDGAKPNKTKRESKTSTCTHCGCEGLGALPCGGGASTTARTGGGCIDTNPCDGDCGVGACSCDINPCG